MERTIRHSKQRLQKNRTKWWENGNKTKHNKSGWAEVTEGQNILRGGDIWVEKWAANLEEQHKVAG